MISAFALFWILPQKSVNMLTVGRRDLINGRNLLFLFSEVQKNRIIMSLLCFLVILYLWLVRIVKKWLQVLIFPRIVLSWIYHKLLDSVILDYFNRIVMLVFSKTLFSFQVFWLVNNWFFRSRWFEVVKTVSMIGLIRWVLMICIIGMKS
jgi:hypothetical protein